jgi:hypothetical protein
MIRFKLAAQCQRFVSNLFLLHRKLQLADWNLRRRYPSVSMKLAAGQKNQFFLMIDAAI